MDNSKPLSYYAAKFAAVYIIGWCVVLTIIGLITLPFRLARKQKPRNKSP